MLLESSCRSILEEYDPANYRSVENGYLNPDIQLAFAKFVRAILDVEYGIHTPVTFIYGGRSGLIFAAACCGHNPDRCYSLGKEKRPMPSGRLVFVDDHICSGATFLNACQAFEVEPAAAISITCSYNWDNDPFDSIHQISLRGSNV